MKKIFLLLSIALLSICAFSQPYFPIYGSAKVYGDSISLGGKLKIYVKGDSVIFSGDTKEFVLRDSTLIELIQEHGGGGGDIFASQGLTKDGDTIKIGSSYLTNGAEIIFQNSIGLALYSDYQSLGDLNEPTAFITVRQADSTIEFGSHNFGLIYNGNGLYFSNDAQLMDTSKWTDYHVITKRWALDNIPDQNLAGAGITIVNDTIKFSGTYMKTGNILLYGSYAGDYSQLEISPGGITTLSNTDDVKGNVSFQIDSDLQTISMGLGSGPIFKANDYGFKYQQLSGSLTDGAPTASEITAIVGVSASSVDSGAGFQVTIKDTNGTGLLYKIESDGTSWYYTAMTKAL